MKNIYQKLNQVKIIETNRMKKAAYTIPVDFPLLRNSSATVIAIKIGCSSKIGIVNNS